MAEQEKKSKRPRIPAQLVKELIFLAIGVALIVQPWLQAVEWLGWVIVAISALIACTMAMRMAHARKMQKSVVAEFRSGDAVFEKGFCVGGVLYDFSTPGAQLESADFDGACIRVRYSFYGRKRGRVRDELSIPVEMDEAGKAQQVMDFLNLPKGVPEEDEKPAEAEEAAETAAELEAQAEAEMEQNRKDR